jgi:hypothetical protein
MSGFMRLRPLEIQTRALAEFYLDQAIATLEMMPGREASVAKTNAETARLWVKQLPDEPVEKADNTFGGFVGVSPIGNAALTRIASAEQTIGSQSRWTPSPSKLRTEWVTHQRRMEVELYFQGGNNEVTLNDLSFLHIGALMVFEEKRAAFEEKKRREAELEQQAVRLKVASQVGDDWKRRLRDEILGKEFIY